MRKTGKILPAVLFVFVSSFAFAAAEVQTELSHTRAAVGEELSLTISLPGAGSGLKITEMPKVDGLKISFSGTRRNFQYINGRASNSLSVIFSVVPQTAGRFTVPPIEFREGDKGYVSNAVSLTVTESSGRTGSSGPTNRSRGGTVVRGLCEPSATKTFVGQPVLLRYFILSDNIPVEESHLEKMPEASGFMIKLIDEKLPDELMPDGLLKQHLYTAVCIPAESGEKSIGGGSAIVSVITGGGFFNMVKNVSLRFEKSNVSVLPLPLKGRPANFSGNVGHFTMTVAADADEVEVFGEKKIQISITGNGNIFTPAKPVFVPSVNDLRLFIEEGLVSLGAEEGGEPSGRIDFNAVFIPEKAGEIEAGIFEFNFYDPTKGAYVSLKSEPVRLTVTDNSEDAKRQVNIAAENGASFDFILPLVILFAVLGCIVFVILKERNRYGKPIINDDKTEAKNNEETQVGDISALSRSLREAKVRDDYETFCRTVGLLFQILSADASFAGTDELRTLSSVQNEIYTLRFANGSISKENIEDWSARLEAAGLL